MDLPDRPLGFPASLPSAWRRLPLTAQLAVVGMLVSLAWFLAARLAADQVEEVGRARADEIAQLHQTEAAATRLMVSLSTLSSSHRGFVLTGDTAHLARYAQARRAFSTDSSLVHTLGVGDPRIVTGLVRMSAILGRWEAAVARPNIALRASTGLAAFGEGTSGARRIADGAIAFDSLRLIHAGLLRDAREDVIRLEFEAESAAAREGWEAFVLRTAAVAVFILVITLLMRLVSRALTQVVTAAEALDAGRYGDARLPKALTAPNREMARLATTFDRLALSIAARERQLHEDIEKLTELERLKADFVSTVSHELRTPLTSMRGALGLLLGGKAGDLPPQGRELVRIALTNTDRLIRLINDILDIEKMDAGHVEIRRDRLRLLGILESTVAGLQGFARDADVRLTLDGEDDIEVIGDPDRLIQVVTNLASNAIKFSPKGAAVEIGLRSDGAQALVTVRDHGPGIAPEFASRIFGRFQQAGGAESRRSGGTGLGLSIAKGITELHGGQVGFDAAEGGGSVFWVTLPLAPEITGVRDARPGVLILEDDASMRDVLAALIEPFARPIGARDADAAFAALRRGGVAVAIVDHGLPGMDGLAFVRQLRRDAKLRTLPILLYSAHEFAPDELRASGIRVADAFVKTRDPEAALVDRVRRELLGA